MPKRCPPWWKQTCQEHRAFGQSFHARQPNTLTLPVPIMMLGPHVKEKYWSRVWIRAIRSSHWAKLTLIPTYNVHNLKETSGHCAVQGPNFLQQRREDPGSGHVGSVPRFQKQLGYRAATRVHESSSNLGHCLAKPSFVVGSECRDGPFASQA